MSQRLNSYFRTSPELRQLSGKAGRLLALQRQYEQLAPASLLRHSRVEQLEGPILTLAADNGAVAAKLRQLAPDLVRQLRDKGYEVTGIQVRVQVALPAPGHAARKATLGQAGREQLLELAAGLPDSPLKNALRRFAGKAAPPAKS